MDVDEKPLLSDIDQPQEQEIVPKGKGKEKDTSEKQRFEVKKVTWMTSPPLLYTNMHVCSGMLLLYGLGVRQRMQLDRF
jgi:hypothetical protein